MNRYRSHRSKKSGENSNPQFSEMGKVKCTKCGKEMIFGTHKSINTELQPELADDVITGKIYSVDCPDCGTITNVDYEMLYHNPSNKFMIYRGMNDEQVQEMVEQYEAIKAGKLPELKGSNDGYIIRVVNSVNEMREKAYVLESGMDDRALELTKIVVYKELIKMNPEAAIAELRLLYNTVIDDAVDKDSEEYLSIKYVDGSVQGVVFPEAIYDEIEKTVFEGKVQEQPYIVDFRWAIEFLKGLR